MTTAIDDYADIARRLKAIEGKPSGVLIVTARELQLIREQALADPCHNHQLTQPFSTALVPVPPPPRRP
jgi:hypothetical protein